MNVVRSWRDLGREGPGRHRGNTPWTDSGIFIVSQQKVSDATRESGPGLSPERRNRVENPMLKQLHDFVEVSWLCLHCHMLQAGHDRLMEQLRTSATVPVQEEKVFVDHQGKPIKASKSDATRRRR